MQFEHQKESIANSLKELLTTAMPEKAALYIGNFEVK